MISLCDVVVAPGVPRTRTETTLHFLVQTHMQIEKLRMATDSQCSTVLKQGFNDPYLSQVRQKVCEFEEWIEAEIRGLVISHPAWPWLNQVKGVGMENIGKVIAFVGDISRFPTVSKLWSYSGYSVKNGEAPRKVKGQKVTWNKNLRIMCWRLGVSLIRARGAYYHYYQEMKVMYERRYEGRIVKAKKGESVPAGMITIKHIHNMALRRMIKIFLSHLWEVWREAEGLAVSAPYAIDRLGYVTPIEPFTG